MENWNSEPLEYVEAIEEGKIVKVSEEYAKKEGLPILRRPKPKVVWPTQKKQEEKRISFDDLRKPLNWKSSQVFPDLMDNFHWEITKKRKKLGMSRKQLADSINESENTLKLVENGVLPKDDFKIINKIQERLHINLRKDALDFSQPMRELIDSPPKEKTEEGSEEKITGKDIELIE